jgi:hypothetical protein
MVNRLTMSSSIQPSTPLNLLALAAQSAIEGDIQSSFRFQMQATAMAQDPKFIEFFESWVYLDACFTELFHRCLKEQIQDKSAKSYVYFILDELNNAVKIGTTIDIKKRLSAIQCGQSQKLKLLKLVEGTYELELELHEKFVDFRISGEWFKAHKTLIAYISKLKQVEI